jgi:hypothetical protein
MSNNSGSEIGLNTVKKYFQNSMHTSIMCVYKTCKNVNRKVIFKMLQNYVTLIV